jgi:L-asparaginase
VNLFGAKMTLVIHTGGTIGMAEGPHGLIPAPGLVERAVAGRARLVAFDPLLDSANISAAHWNRMLDLIEAEAGPLVVTHGTDTMAYSGAALSQALAGWPHPVVLTGSMRPLGFGGDAEANLDLALSARPGPGVWLAFAGQLLPAAGLVKTESQGADAFRALPQPVETGVWQRRRFAPRRVAELSVTPGLVPEVFAAALAQLDGAVLRVFGAGTVPAGLAPGAYAAGQGLWDVGVENGGLETAEAAFIRLWLALSAQS